MCDPTGGIATGVVAVAQGGLGIASASAGYQAEKEAVRYRNYEAQSNYRYQQQQAQSAREFEQSKFDQQEALRAQTRALADIAYGQEVSAINARFMQEQEVTAQQKQKSAIAGMQARGSVLAAGRVGNSIDSLVNDYYRQQGQYDDVTDRNLAFVSMQSQEQKRASGSERANRIASQQEYVKQQIYDPIAPIKQKAPSSTPYLLQAGGALLTAGVGINKSMNMPKRGDESMNMPKRGN